MKRLSVRVLTALIVVGAVALRASISADQAPPSQANIHTELAKVEVTLARFQGSTRTSSVPYTLVAATTFEATLLRLGVRVPTGANTVTTREGVMTTEPEYRTVGTNIDVQIRPQAGVPGLYQLSIQVNDTSIHPAKLEGMNANLVQPLAFREYFTRQTLWMRNGEELEFSVGTDKVTGETIRASVKLTVPQ